MIVYAGIFFTACDLLPGSGDSSCLQVQTQSGQTLWTCGGGYAERYDIGQTVVVERMHTPGKSISEMYWNISREVIANDTAFITNTVGRVLVEYRLVKITKVEK